jgi:hypothetical protein
MSAGLKGRSASSYARRISIVVAAESDFSLFWVDGRRGGEHREAEVLANTELSDGPGLRNPSEPPGPHR